MESFDAASRQLTEKDFDERYTLSEQIDGCTYPNGLLETYGAEGELARTLSQTTHRVWTAVDGGEGLYYIAGYHYVNRLHYIVTDEEWSDEGEEYLMVESGDEA